MNKKILDFFEERKAAWLKKNLSDSSSEQERQALKQGCEESFAFSNWLPQAAKRAGQMSISTHPCTFSHPSARKNKNGYASAVIAESIKRADGFLRTGNIAVEADALGNAAVLDVHKFLTLEMEDGQTLIQHIEQDTLLAQQLLTLPGAFSADSYSELKQGFMAMTARNETPITSSKIKQVYFPVSSLPKTAYHQLSLLTASGIVFEMRKRLDNMRFGEEVKIAREKRKANQQHGNYREIYDLTTIGYGGTKPQNISVLNNQNGGKAHLLLSLPPTLKKRDVHFPKTDFFAQSVNYFVCRDIFHRLHNLYLLENNNMEIREQRDELYQEIIDYVLESMWKVRAVAGEQYSEVLSQLTQSQTVWLCEHTKAEREDSDDWLNEVAHSTAQFIVHGYKKVLGRKAILLGHAELKHMEKMVSVNTGNLR